MRTRKNPVIFYKLILLTIFIITVSILLKGILKSKPDDKTILNPVSSKPVLNQFGFAEDSLTKHSYVVNRNETLSDILAPYHLAKTNVSEIAIASKNIFDVRKIRTGKTYHIYTADDSLMSVKYMVYEKDPVNFVIYDLNDSVRVYEGKKNVTIKKETKAATINTSLYVALEESKTDIELAIRLSQIYAWQIDFYRLQKGDKFKIIYEEEYVDSQMVGIGKVLGAYFYHNNKDFFAIPFEQDSIYQYFDENGNSLRKEFLKTPIEFARISSRYTSRRLHPILKVYRPHYGVDYAAPTGTPIRTVGDGTVVEAAYGKANGRYVKIKHNSVYTTMYLHMSGFAKGIKKGTKVKQGQVIGYVGSTGLATGPHLHFIFYINGNLVDPLKIELPPSHPIKDELKEKFEEQKFKVLNELNTEGSGEKHPA
ncbi:murein DD-endopeptidase MepM [bacterium BMS3Abin03]|nr:murein DD-endopeptidase MepM [bacterium BMS3Abin03]